MSTKKIQILGSFSDNISVDETLSQSGKAADAKATGDAIRQAQTSADELSVIVENLDSKYYTESEIDDKLDIMQSDIDAKYTKPETGISESDLSADIQKSLGLANTAIQEHQDISGKLDATAQAVDSAKLNGESAEYYLDYNNFTNTPTIPSTEGLATEAQIAELQSGIDTKVDKVEGKGLSTNDYTTSEKDKLETVEANANFYEHPTHTSHNLGLYKVTVDGFGHVSGVALAEKEDIVALGIPAQDTVYDDSELSNRIGDVENDINTTNQTLSGVSQELESYKATNNEAVATNASNIQANKTAIEAIQSDYLTSTDKTQLQDNITEVSNKATANASAIEVLNGEGEGSVKQSIDNAFNEFAANVTNDDVVNTYKELIDYAAAHGPEFTELVGKVDTINTHVGEVEADLSNYKTEVSEQFTEVDTTINNHVTNTNNPHGVTKEQIGLENVDNTSDLEKPISYAVDEALQGKADFEHEHEIGEINSLQDLLDGLQVDIDTKANVEHNHDDLYYDKDEILGLITVEDIDDICASTQSSDENIDFTTVASKYWVEQYYQLKGDYLTEVPDGYATEEFVENKIAEQGVGDVNNLQTTSKNLTDAVNEVLDAVDDVSAASAITLTTKGASESFANVYELKQGNNVIGNINILKDMVVESGEVVDIDGVKNIKLVLQNVENPLYIPVGSLVDMYVAQTGAAQVQIAIDSNTREISAYLVASSVTATELATNAVITEKIADKNVTKVKLSSEVQDTLDKADVAEKNAKDYADSLDDAMDTRMLSVEAKLTNIDNNNVVSKAHEHTNKDELDLIASGDKAKWDKTVTDLADEIVRAKAAEQANATAIADAVAEAKKKVASVSVGDNSVTVAGTVTAPTVAVKLSQDDDNIMELVEDGLKVVAPTAAEYTIEKTAGSSDYDAVYKLMKDGAQVGASINIPKNMVVKSGSVVDGNIVLVLNDDDNTEIIIPADSLIGQVTSGSTDGDMVVINISDDHKVTATITNGSITMTKLAPDVLVCFDGVHSHENADVLAGINADSVVAWNAAKTHADSDHASSDAEKNQNAFSNIKVDSTTIAADTTTDTLTLVGSNVIITPDATNNKVTIGITKDNVVSTLGYEPANKDTSVTMYKTVTGESIILNDSSESAVAGLRVFGKTIQNGTPTPDTPVELVSVGDGGKITVKIGVSESDENPQTLTVSTPNGLPGIPVTSGGNYTDENGQQWACDYVDFEKGVYVRNIQKVILDGTENYSVNGTNGYYTDVSRVGQDTNGVVYEGFDDCQRISCSHFEVQPKNVNVADRTHGMVIVYTTTTSSCRFYFVLDDTDMATYAAEQYALGNPVIVLYQRLVPIETALTAEELAAYAAMHTNYPNTTVFNDAGAGMEVKYSDNNGIQAAGTSFGLVRSGGDVSIDNGIITVTKDSEMSTTSTNAVQNKVVQAAITSAINSLREEFSNGSW